MIRYGVVYAPEATDQLEELYLYIAERRSPAVAEHYTSAVIETCEGLACPRRSNFDPPCRLNFDPGLVAGIA